MKKAVIFIIAILAFVSLIFALEPEENSYKPPEGYVPNAETAIKIAEAVLIPIYGVEVINKEKPLKAELQDSIWIVTGTLHCPEGDTCKGGVAEIDISKDDGTILRVTHGE